MDDITRLTFEEMLEKKEVAINIIDGLIRLAETMHLPFTEIEISWIVFHDSLIEAKQALEKYGELIEKEVDNEE